MVRPPHKNPLLVVGGLLLFLGVGNWTIGTRMGAPYESYLESHPAPRTAGAHPRSHLLRPPDEERQQRTIAHAKLDFYRLAQSGGRVMILLAVVCLLGALVSFQMERRTTSP